MFRHWLRPRPSSARRPFTPRVEQLEEIATPATFTVTTLSDAPDPATVSLRDAVASANSTAGADTIEFDASLSGGTITLTGGQLTLTDTATTTITGPAAGVTIARDANAAESRILEVAVGGRASLSGLTMSGGFLIGDAPGVLNKGTLSMSDCTISGNRCFAFTSGDRVFGYGGGLFNTGAATLTDCTISGNDAREGGGGVENLGTLAMTDCDVTGNNAGIVNGGGLSNRGTATLTDCTISGNSSRGGGGVFNTGTATLTGCDVSGNTARNGKGGGVLNLSAATLFMTNCTVSGNTTQIGIPGLNDPGNGGGVCNEGSATLTNCTITSNFGRSGGGVFDAGTTVMSNTIVARNQRDALGGGHDASGTIDSQGYNLIGKTDGSSGWLADDLTGTDDQPLDPLLAALGDYGGPTQTLALLPGSPALDAGNNDLFPEDLDTDQRGVVRFLNGTVDIGAFESRGFTIAVTSGSGQSAKVASAFAAPLVATVTANDASEPVAGGRVTFTAPAGGASAAIGGSLVSINADGTASASATANWVAGSYAVSATAAGVSTPANFSLANNLSVVSIVRASPNPTTARMVKWTVTFSDAVTGVNLSDFRLVMTNGLSGASLVRVTGSGNVYTVKARTGTIRGKLGLNLVDNDTIQDGAGMKLGGAGAGNGNFTGPKYTKR